MTWMWIAIALGSLNVVLFVCGVLAVRELDRLLELLDEAWDEYERACGTIP